MPHNIFKAKFHLLNSGLSKCSCGQTFEYGLERDRDMKFWLHRKVFPDSPEVYEQVWRTKKAMMQRKAQLNEAKRMKRVHDHH